MYGYYKIEIDLSAHIFVDLKLFAYRFYNTSANESTILFDSVLWSAQTFSDIK